ncbi:ribonuclease H-like domain-containing protein [Tanacetum coccineum]
MTRRVLLRCDSTGDLYPVTASSPVPHAFLVSQHTWHQCVGHPGSEVLRRLVSHNFISCNKEKPPALCHACQLGKHVRLSFASFDIMVTSCFDIIHSDVWTSPISSLSGYKYYGTDTAYLLLYVVDIVLAASSEDLVMRDWMFLSRKKYVVEILERAHMVNCNPSRTPIDTESKLGSDGDVVFDPKFSTIGLVSPLHNDRLPATVNNLLSWSSKHQSTLSCSSAEEEYRGVANAVAKTCWLRNLLRELHTLLSSATFVYCDNVSDAYLSCNPVQHQRTKHIEIDIRFVHDLVVAGQVRVLHVSSRYQVADIFPNGFPSALFEEFRSSLSVQRPPAPTMGEC